MRWTYGDSVQAKIGAIVKPAEVVSITVVEGRQSEVFGFPPGTVLYTVEFPDGSDALIPEGALLPSSVP